MTSAVTTDYEIRAQARTGFIVLCFRARHLIVTDCVSAAHQSAIHTGY